MFPSVFPVSTQALESRIRLWPPEVSVPTQSGPPPAVAFPAMSVFCTTVLLPAETPPPPPPELGRLDWFPEMVQLVIVDWLSVPVRDNPPP